MIMKNIKHAKASNLNLGFKVRICFAQSVSFAVLLKPEKTRKDWQFLLRLVRSRALEIQLCMAFHPTAGVM
jgi:hypothetical protein